MLGQKSCWRKETGCFKIEVFINLHRSRVSLLSTEYARLMNFYSKLNTQTFWCYSLWGNGKENSLPNLVTSLTKVIKLFLRLRTVLYIAYTWRSIDHRSTCSEWKWHDRCQLPPAEHHFYHFTTTRSLIQLTRRDGLLSLLVANYEAIW